MPKAKKEAPPAFDNGELARRLGVQEVAPSDAKLIIPAVHMDLVHVRLRGIDPLVVRAWDQKTMQQLEEKAKGKKASRSREPVDPEAVFNGARYLSTEGWDGFPSGGFKAALVDAVSCYDMPKTEFSMKAAKMTVFAIPDGICRLSGRPLIRIRGPEPEMYKVMQPTSGGGPYMSYRPLYRHWWCHLTVEFNARRVGIDGVLNLIAMAGKCVGVGEHRPSAKESKTGTFGRWEIVSTEISDEELG